MSFSTWFLYSATPILFKNELVGGDANGAELFFVGLQVAGAIPHWGHGHVAWRYGGGRDHHQWSGWVRGGGWTFCCGRRMSGWVR